MLLCTAENDGSSPVAFMLFLRSFTFHSSLHTYCVDRLHCFYEMRSFNSPSVILGVLLQLKPAYTRSYSSPPTPNGNSIQSIEARQEPTVVVASEFLRRGFHACQY